MNKRQTERGKNALREVLRKSRILLISVVIFSFFVNVLVLTAPMYMSQVYDRVLNSRSLATLVALTLLMTFLFIIMGCLDYVRSRVLIRIGARFQDELDEAVFGAEINTLRRTGGLGKNHDSINDVNTVLQLFSSPVMTAIFDVPATPIFLIIAFIFHPWLGVLVLTGGTILIAITVLNQKISQNLTEVSHSDAFLTDKFSARMRSENQMIGALGMTDNARTRWVQLRRSLRQSSLRVSDLQGRFMVLSKTFRQFLQSAMLGLGAYLSLQGEVSGGTMMAGSLLLGRALAPIDMAIGQWALLQKGVMAWRSLAEQLSEGDMTATKTTLPDPEAFVQAQNIIVIPPGKNLATLMNVSFELKPGTAMGIIGSSGAGKSTLAHIMTGANPPTRGTVRLGGPSLEHYSTEARSRYIGYLPQRVQLFDGSITENIARLSPSPDDAKVVEAAKVAGAHELILSFDDGYDTMISATNSQLSGGQIQRICLARALYGNPMLLILDEPNSNLDHEGTNALNLAIAAVKKRGGVVIITAHRPTIIQKCDKLLVLDGGHVSDFGDRDDVLKKTVKNSQQINNLHSGAKRT
jgi:ATP-binding cassette subfamily C protein